MEEGRTLGGKYRVVRAIGRGGTGEVFEAHRLDAGEPVAIKVLDREWAKDAVVAGRFAREARAASEVASEHIVRVLDGGTEDGRPYLVMELLRGEDLGRRLRRARRLPVAEALHIAGQVLRGLAAAHAAGVVHRDLKPDNVILVEGTPAAPAARAPLVKLVDFGMSKIDRPEGRTAPLALTRKGVVLGTPLYMSPEQARASPHVDRRADLYSVGAILFECLAGRPPHVGETHEQVLLAICMEDAPDVRRWAPDVPEQVAELVTRALAKEKEDRFQSAEEMLAAVEAAERGQEAKPREDAAERRRARRRLATTAVLATIAGAVVMLLVLAAMRLQSP